MRKAIVTKYIGPTNSKGSRVKVQAEGLPAMFVAWDDSLGSEDMHTAAVHVYVKARGWGNPEHWIGGGNADGGGYTFVDASGPMEAAEAGRQVINSMRKGTWTGNPWSRVEFRDLVRRVAALHGFFGDILSAPTTDEELAAFKAPRR